uniref:Uncharacterized protein n=1 Tax=Arundo donax TaxID=35708 RepID=A0A0A9FBV6_ARUDO
MVRSPGIVSKVLISETSVLTILQAELLIWSGVTSAAFDLNVVLLFLLPVRLMFIATSSVLVLG